MPLVSARVAELRESPDQRRITVVIVDDDGPFLESLRRAVDEQPRCAVVGTAENGLEAIELVDELQPEVVVIDLHMPLLDGVSAVASMRHDHPVLRLIAITADSSPDLHRAVEEAGADAVLMKDELIQELGSTIAEHSRRISA
jgi:DNA-binding NarL/FixJ family response regulator